MKTTLYLFMPSKLAIYNFEQQRTKPGVPMLNESGGEELYTTPQQAKDFGLFICDNPEVDSNSVAVIHMTFDQTLRDELEKSGDIKSGGTDGQGHPLLKVSARACARLNREAEFLMAVFPLPLFVRQPNTPGSKAYLN